MCLRKEVLIKVFMRIDNKITQTNIWEMWEEHLRKLNDEIYGVRYRLKVVLNHIEKIMEVVLLEIGKLAGGLF